MTWKDPNKEPPPTGIDILVLVSENGREPYPMVTVKLENGVWMRIWELHEKVVAWMPIPENPKWIKKDEN